MYTAPSRRPPFGMPAPRRVIRAARGVLRRLGVSTPADYLLIAEMARLAAAQCRAQGQDDPWWLELIHAEADSLAGVHATSPTSQRGSSHGSTH